MALLIQGRLGLVMHLVQWRIRSGLGILLVLHFSLLFGESNGHERLPVLYKDSRQSVHVRVQDLLSRMTLEEKIGQMTQIEKTVANSTVLEKFKIGSILSSPFPSGKPGNFATAVQWANMTDSFQSAALRTRLSIPLIYGIDAVHGHNGVFGATIFPHNVGLGCTREPELLRRIGSATALEVRATGIPYVFGPCIAVCRDPRWGRCYESFSEDPEVVTSMTTIIDGLQGKAPPDWQGPYVQNSRKVAACAKHFVGDGGTVDGIDRNNTVISFQGLVNIHMRAYFDAVAKGVSTIMVSYSSWNGIKMHANRFLLTDILKGHLGFEGFLISDFQGIDRITEPPGVNYSDSVLLSINAGIDMVMVPYAYQNFSAIMKKHVMDRKIRMSRIDDAVSRILRVKFETGLFEAPYSSRRLNTLLGAPSHGALAREAVRKSLVLLKNGKPRSKALLPLDRNARKILVVGAHANDIGLQCGGWTITWQGSPGNITKGTTILEGILQTVSSKSKLHYKASPQKGYAKGKNYTYAIVVVGEQPYAEMNGDNMNLTLPDPYPGLIQDTCSHVPCVVVLISGRPLVMEKLVRFMDAFVAAWLPGTEGAGVAEVLFGKHEFQGKLSRTWFKRVDQLPMNIGDEDYDPLYPFGYGLKMGL
ncbi:hypothetical protein KC19_3G035200 [Ceratodon purpureus]|uniref:beta-glucosidase n=1 Tax=Ceratodon purpureus TaxID=3225 RepID=A0A8T0IFG1_CERPU|nr:hypothetical protein KC19_3G035200 [Ceratodon purpureus]